MSKYKEAITRIQADIIAKSLDENYPLEDSIADIDIVADLTELKIKKGADNERKS